MSATFSNAKYQKKNLRNSEDGSKSNIHSMALKYIRLGEMNVHLPVISTHSRQDIKALQCFDPFSHQIYNCHLLFICHADQTSQAKHAYKNPTPWSFGSQMVVFGMQFLCQRC